MKSGKLAAWLAMFLGVAYFLAPLIATFEFSLRMRRGEYSFDAYRVVLASARFPAIRSSTPPCSACPTIVVGILIVVPTAYWVQLRLPKLRGLVEFITLLPLVIPAIVLVFGYVRLYGSSSILPLTATSLGADALLMFGYVGLGLPYMYRSVETALRSIDVRTLTEAAESQGAGICDHPGPHHPAQHPLRHPVGARSSPSPSSSASSPSPACSIGRLSAPICNSSAPTAPTSRRRWRSSPSR